MMFHDVPIKNGIVSHCQVFFYKRVPIYRQPEEQNLLINEEFSLQNHDASFKKKRRNRKFQVVMTYNSVDGRNPAPVNR